MSSIAINDDVVAVSRGNLIDCFDHSNHNITQICDKDANEYITDIAISYDNNYLAIITTIKRLIVYSLPQLKRIKTIILPRSASKVNFATNSPQIFIADKTGDVLSYNILDDSGGNKLLGHLSLLLNVLHTNDGKYLITSDRDEKIRVSHYPNTYNIQTYCLGHKEFVHHIALLAHNDNILISASGDGTVKFWDYVTGILHYTIDVNSDVNNNKLKEEFREYMDKEGLEVSNLPIVHITQTRLNEFCTLLAVSVHSLKNLLLYSLKTEDSNFIHKLETEITLENFPAAVIFHKTSLLVYEHENSLLLKYEVFYDKIKDIQKVNRIQLFENQNVDVKVDSDIENIKVLFKRKFDNVQEYQERKKQRLAKPISNI